jgi:histidinol-phosphate/aromatic aminotransferase/cobyric acid decarboxylase-like protein
VRLAAPSYSVNAVSPDQILLGDGSGEILKLCAETFTGPKQGKLVVADPTFEAILNHATVGGAEVVKILLTSSFVHDLLKMAASAKEGLIYVCNPNNPTGSITPNDDLVSSSPRLRTRRRFSWTKPTFTMPRVPITRA